MFVQRFITIKKQEKVIEIQIFKLLVSKLSSSFKLAYFDIACISGMYFIALFLCKDSLLSRGRKSYRNPNLLISTLLVFPVSVL